MAIWWPTMKPKESKYYLVMNDFFKKRATKHDKGI